MCLRGELSYERTVTNPIQAVLDAEARAEAEIAAAEQASEQAVSAARTDARNIVAGNEARTLAAAQRFEARSGAELETEIEELKQSADNRLQQFLEKMETERERIAEEVFREFWPE